MGMVWIQIRWILKLIFGVEVFSELSVNYGFGPNLINNKNNNNIK